MEYMELKDELRACKPYDEDLEDGDENLLECCEKCPYAVYFDGMIVSCRFAENGN